MNKPKTTQPETPNKPQGRDLFQTPNYATDLLVPFIPKNVKYVWECAAGEGKISNRLSYHGYSVYQTDIRQASQDIHLFNFLTDESAISDRWAIITNPPFSLKRKFFEKCIEYDVPFALLISADYCLWTIDAIRTYGCEKIIPDHRIDFITPTGKSGATGHTSYFHSLWITRYFNLRQTETFVDLTKKMKEKI